MTQRTIEWALPGAEGAAVIGDTHLPDGDPADALATVLITHGFLGYKDYGMFPRLAQVLCDHGCIAHRFNLSHSGMTRQTDRFERPDLFERDTWMKQAADLHCLLDALGTDVLAGAGPAVLLGHSRGGVASILAAGQRVRESRTPQIDGVITLAAPDTACSLPAEAREQMLDRGFGEVVSNRTGQTLRIGSDWLREQLEDPIGHDVHASAGAIRCPMLVLHGDADETVPAGAADRIASAARDATVRLIDGANHVFNVPNPLPGDAPASPEFETVLRAVVGFVQEQVAGGC